MAQIETGQSAPDFELPGDGGSTIRLSDHRGKAVVLFFYPKDDTTGCTAEATAFSGLAGEFEAAGAVLIGISPDSVRSHDKFKSKHALTVPLAADEERTALEAYGVWVEKSMYGKKYMGVERTTVLVAPDGTVARVWPKVKVPGHAEEVLEAVRSL